MQKSVVVLTLNRNDLESVVAWARETVLVGRQENLPEAVMEFLFEAYKKLVEEVSR